MYTFIESEKVLGAALALSPMGRVTETELGQLETYIYTRAPHYTILFSSVTVRDALSTYRNIFSIDNDDTFIFVDGENSRLRATSYFVNTLEDGFVNLMKEFFAGQ
jgi:hypothetical protein